MRYMAGCRCLRCRNGNRDYERKMVLDRKRLGPNDLVPVKKALAHVKWLRSFGMGPKTIGKHAKISKTSIREWMYSGRSLMRRRNEARVLAVMPTLQNLPRNVNVDAAPTVTLIRKMIKWGYTKTLITRDGLGTTFGGLQIRSLKGKTDTVIVRTALRIEAFYSLVAAMRRVWTQARGRMPARRYVYWNHRRGRRPKVPKVSRLELRSFPVTYDWNYIYPQELKDVMSLNRNLRKQYRKLARKGQRHAKK